MGKFEVLSFEEAVAKSGSGKNKLLTGNGFSMAWDHERFSYKALFDRARKDLPKEVRGVFSSLKTSDFEVVMRMFRDASRLVEVYRGNRYPKLAKSLQAEADRIRDALAQAVSASHPDRPTAINEKQYRACRKFLSNFDAVYTLNYDLLLYWTLMHEELGETLSHDDGFRTPEDGPAEYVVWEVDHSTSQKVFYLHGALHVFDAGHEVQKFTWCNTGIALVDQIRSALDDGKFPIFVAEGTSNEKMARIQHSGYLNRAYRSFASISNPLFIFGHSLAENDDHIIRLIERGKVRQLFISLFGDASSDGNKAIIARGKAIAFRSEARTKPDIHFFDAASAEVWGKVKKS